MLLDVCCNAHVLHRVVTQVFDLHSFMPKMHSVAFTMTVAKHWLPVLRTLRSVVVRDLELGFFPDSAPNDACLSRTRTLVDMTILRLTTTRGREEFSSKFGKLQGRFQTEQIARQRLPHSRGLQRKAFPSRRTLRGNLLCLICRLCLPCLSVSRKVYGQLPTKRDCRHWRGDYWSC